MYFLEFQFWAILPVLFLFEILDSATTWYVMRLTGKSFKVIEKNPKSRRLGLGRSTILVLLFIVAATAYVYFFLPSSMFSSPVAVIAAPILFSLSYFTKFNVVIDNFRVIRKYIREKKREGTGGLKTTKTEKNVS